MHAYFEYDYAPTFDAAKDMLEDMFATGDVVAAENPKIETIKRANGKRVWCIKLRAD